MHPVVVCQTPVAGGAERYMKLLYRGMSERGHTPALIGQIPGWVEETGLPAVSALLGPKWSGRRTIKSLPSLPRERQSVKSIVESEGLRPDIFHVQFKREQIGLTSMLGKSAPVLWTEHGRFTQGLEGRLLAAGYRQAARRAAAIVCVSDAVAVDVSRIVGPSVRVEVIANAVDTSVLRPATAEVRASARAQLGLPAEGPVLAWVGQVHAGKLPLLAADVGRSFEGTTVMAGTGALEDELRNSVDGRRVRFLGYQSNPRLIYAAADVFLFTSSGANEGHPYSILEAASHGLPLVVNEASGMSVLAAESGGLVGSEVAEELAELAELAIREGDRATRARSWALRHDLESWVSAHELLMQELV